MTQVIVVLNNDVGARAYTVHVQKLHSLKWSARAALCSRGRFVDAKLSRARQPPRARSESRVASALTDSSPIATRVAAPPERITQRVTKRRVRRAAGHGICRYPTTKRERERDPAQRGDRNQDPE